MLGSPQAHNQGGESPLRKVFVPTGKMCWTYFETIAHSAETLSAKTLSNA